MVGFYKHVDVYSMADASIEFSVKLNGRSNDVAFLDDTTFALAGEMPHIEIYSLVTKELLHKFEAHETRVRCMAFIQPSCLISGSNDGFIKVWKVTRDGDTFDIIEDGSADTKCRITSMQVRKNIFFKIFVFSNKQKRNLELITKTICTQEINVQNAYLVFCLIVFNTFAKS